MICIYYDKACASNRQHVSLIDAPFLDRYILVHRAIMLLLYHSHTRSSCVGISPVEVVRF